MTYQADGKQRHADVLRAVQAAAKTLGGLSEVARMLGLNESLIRMKFNPNDASHQPTAVELLDVIQMTGSTVAVNAISMKVGHVSIPEGSLDLSPSELARACQEMLAACGKTIHETAGGLADGKLNHEERQRIAACCDALIPMLIGIRTAARG